MTHLRLEVTPDEARALVIEAFRRTDGISSIEKSSHQIVGKTGISFARVLWSYGENIYVDFSDPTEEGKVPIEVWAEKSVWTNITADPQKYQRRFLEELEDIRGLPIGELNAELVEEDSHSFQSDNSDGENLPSDESRGVGKEQETRSRDDILPKDPFLGYGVIILVGGFVGYVFLFLIADIINSVLSFWLGTLAGLFVSYHIYNENYSVVQGVEIPLGFLGAWHGTGILYQVVGLLPRGVFGMFILGFWAYLGAGVGVAAWRLVGVTVLKSILE